MKLSTTDTTSRRVLLSILLASLVITSGCAGFLSGDSSGATETETATATSATTPAPNSSDTNSGATGTDLRSISIPDSGSVTAEGELDSGDPQSGGKYYEPVQVAAVENQTVNITMISEGPSPGLRVRNPDGNVTFVISNETGTATGIVFGTFSQTGRYTLEPTSVADNATFDYTLTIERTERPERNTDEDRELFEGDADGWNETERYLFKTYSHAVVAEAYTERSDTRTLAELPTNLTRGVSNGDITANATGDYAVITYEMPADYSFRQRTELDTALYLSYKAELNQTRNDDSEDESWVPDIIFYRGVDNETGEVVRTTFYTKGLADQYLADEITSDDAFGHIISTERWGPASDVYDDEDFDQVTDEEFPQVYYNYTYPDGTTLAEKYGL